MTIFDLISGYLRPGDALSARRVPGSREGGEDKDQPQPVSAVSREDRVEISEEGRLLASQSEATEELGAQLSPDRLAQIRRRIEDGTYHTAAVAEEIARRLLESGDI